MSKAYDIKTSAGPISTSRNSEGFSCSNCHTKEHETFQIHGSVNLGKRHVSVRLVLCLTCIDHWKDFLNNTRLDGNGVKPRDEQWYPQQ